MPLFRKNAPPGHRVKAILAGYVTGDLDLRGATALREIGRDVRVGGALWLGGVKQPESNLARASDKEPKHSSQCQLAELPEGLSVAGALYLQSCSRIARLPASMRVLGDMELRGLPRLTEIPGDVVRGSRLRLIGLPRLAALPARLPKLAQLVLDGVGIRALPEDLQMAEAGELIVRNCAFLETLPEALLSSGVLRRIAICNCPQLTLPPVIEALGQIVLRRLRMTECSSRLRAPVVSIGSCNSLASVSGPIETNSLTICRCPKVAAIPPPYGLLHLLNVAGCSSFKELPPGLHFGGVHFQSRLDISGCAALMTLPADLLADHVPHRDALLVKIDGSGLKEAPAYSFSWKIDLRNVWLEPDFALHPESVDPLQILLHRNAEVRRVLIDRMGIANLLNRVEHAVIDEDTDAGGARRLIGFRLRTEVTRPRPSRPASFQSRPQRQATARSLGFTFGRFLSWLTGKRVQPSAPVPVPPPRRVSEPVSVVSPPSTLREFDVRFLQCRCPTTQREYLLPVPNNVITCRQAAAWMAGFDNPDDYVPIQET